MHPRGFKNLANCLSYLSPAAFAPRGRETGIKAGLLTGLAHNSPFTGLTYGFSLILLSWVLESCRTQTSPYPELEYTCRYALTHLQDAYTPALHWLQPHAAHSARPAPNKALPTSQQSA